VHLDGSSWRRVIRHSSMLPVTRPGIAVSVGVGVGVGVGVRTARVTAPGNITSD
jgi:hypothetical protein